MMALPLLGFLIDVLLATSLAIWIGVFLIGLFMESPLQCSAFPAVILVASGMKCGRVTPWVGHDPDVRRYLRAFAERGCLSPRCCCLSAS